MAFPPEWQDAHEGAAGEVADVGQGSMRGEEEGFLYGGWGSGWTGENGELKGAEFTDGCEGRGGCR